MSFWTVKGQITVDLPPPVFEGCEQHLNTHSSKMVGNHYETDPVPMMQSSHIALYPLTDNTDAMYLKIMMPSRQFKVHVTLLGKDINSLARYKPQ